MSVLFFANICSRSTSKGTLEPVLQLSIDWRLQVYIWGWICLLFRLFEFNLDFFSQQWRRRRWRRRHIASLSNALLGQYFDWCYQRGREKNQLAEGFISSVNAGNLPPFRDELLSLSLPRFPLSRKSDSSTTRSSGSTSSSKCVEK